jgi:hypothetical protein
MQNHDRERIRAWWGAICSFLEFVVESNDMMQAYYESRLALRCSKNILQAVQPCFDSSEGIEFREWDFLIHDQLEILSGHLETIHASLKGGYALDANSLKALEWLGFNWAPTARNLHRLIVDSSSENPIPESFLPEYAWGHEKPGSNSEVAKSAGKATSLPKGKSNAEKFFQAMEIFLNYHDLDKWPASPIGKRAWIRESDNRSGSSLERFLRVFLSIDDKDRTPYEEYERVFEFEKDRLKSLVEIAKRRIDRFPDSKTVNVDPELAAAGKADRSGLVRRKKMKGG